MLPKKKASEAAVPSATNPPPLEQTAGGEDAGGRTGVDEGAHSTARSKDKVAQTSASAHPSRSSQEARNRQRHGTHSTIRSLDPDRAGGSRDAQGQHARQHAGASVARSPGPGTAPSSIVRNPSTSR